MGHRQWTLVMFAADDGDTDGGQEGYGRRIRGSRTMDTRVTDEIEEGKDGRWLRGSEDG